MRKLILTCDSCGQRMQVPRSAIGRTGMCPSCNTTIKIRSTNTTTNADKGKGRFLGARGNWWRGSGAEPTEEAKRKFGEAVDLYYGGRFAEALAIFDGLNRQFPGNPDIESGRMQCMKALRQPNRTFALEDHSDGFGKGGTSSSFANGAFDEETVRRIILDKMLRSPSEGVQLQAAELAGKMLGLFNRPASDAPEAADAPADEENANEAAHDADGEYVDAGNGAAKAELEDEVEAEDNSGGEAAEPRRRTGSTGFFEL